MVNVMIKARRVQAMRHDDFRRVLFGMTSVNQGEHQTIKTTLLRRSESLRFYMLPQGHGDKRAERLMNALDDAIYLLRDETVRPLAYKPEAIVRLMEAVLGMITASSRLGYVFYHKYYGQIFTLALGLFTSSFGIDRSKYYHEYAVYLMHFHFLAWYIRMASWIVQGNDVLSDLDALYKHVFAWDRRAGRLGYLRNTAKVFAADLMANLVLLNGDPLTVGAQALGWMRPHGLLEAAERKETAEVSPLRKLNEMGAAQALAAIAAAVERDGQEAISEDERMVLEIHKARSSDSHFVNTMISAPAAAVDGEKRPEINKMVTYFSDERQKVHGKIRGVADELRTMSPWAIEMVDFVAEQEKILQLGAGPIVKVPPLLLIGPPGSGKTALAVAFARAAELPIEVVTASGGGDNRDFAGTSAGWSSATPSRPVATIFKHKAANPLIVIDEVDKIGTSRQNGNIADTLLTMIETETSRRYYDEAMRATFDLSMISWIMTANSLDTVPLPLRSRLRILHVSRPGIEHADEAINALFRGILADRGIHPDAAPAIRSDVMAVIRRGFGRQGGADLRRVRAALERALALELTEMVMH